MVPFCLPPETKPVIAGAAGGGGGGGAPMEGKTLAAAGDGGATPDKMSLAACGKTPGTNCGVDIALSVLSTKYPALKVWGKQKKTT